MSLKNGGRARAHRLIKLRNKLRIKTRNLRSALAQKSAAKA